MATYYERVMGRFMPKFRSSAAKAMVKEYGMGQQQAAKYLGVTQAAISKYLNGNDNNHSEIKINNSLVKKFVEYSKADDDRNSKRVVCAMCQMNTKFNCALMVK